jgi:hypothetical protein
MLTSIHRPKNNFIFLWISLFSNLSKNNTKYTCCCLLFVLEVVLISTAFLIALTPTPIIDFSELFQRSNLIKILHFQLESHWLFLVAHSFMILSIFSWMVDFSNWILIAFGSLSIVCIQIFWFNVSIYVVLTVRLSNHFLCLLIVQFQILFVIMLTWFIEAVFLALVEDLVSSFVQKA